MSCGKVLVRLAKAKSGLEAGMWKRSFFLWKRKRKQKREILPLLLPHKLFDLKSNVAKKFCLFPNVD